ncbi:MAG: hypothetical protein QNJ69_11335 [Gammaproteobacteria bacterium]|nr:hypothetical protein [Gammaproteobacteria bacterium]
MAEALYTDSLIRISEDSIVFDQYYFPFGSKQIDIASIDYIEVLMPSLKAGKWRIHGTGDFRTWFPRDKQRPQRDCIFVMYRKNKRWRIGFTAENSKAVHDIFKGKNIPLKLFIPLEHFESKPE